MISRLRFYDRLYRESSARLSFGPRNKKALAVFERIVPKLPILDLGCGDGRHVLYFARRGYQVTGIDYSRAVSTQS